MIDDSNLKIITFPAGYFCTSGFDHGLNLLALNTQLIWTLTFRHFAGHLICLFAKAHRSVFSSLSLCSARNDLRLWFFHGKIVTSFSGQCFSGRALGILLRTSRTEGSRCLHYSGLSSNSSGEYHIVHSASIFITCGPCHTAEQLNACLLSLHHMVISAQGHNGRPRPAVRLRRPS